MVYQLKRTFCGFSIAGCHPFTTTFMVVMFAFCSAYSGWTRIGLEGMKVTSITAGRVWSDTMLFAGTDSGVYYKTGNNIFQLLTSLESTPIPAGLKHVRSLYLASQAHLLAGNDSGLYSYRFTSGRPPAWTKMNEIFGNVVAIAGSGDTITAASQSSIYRSVDGGNTWAPCTLSCTQNRRPVYTSIAFWKGINVGSDAWPGSAQGWIGVANSPDYGHSWNDISQLPGQAQRLNEVYCLSTYAPAWNKPLRLVAGTASGIQWVDDIDTGTWHPLESQLTIALARHLYVTTYTKSNIAMLFASTDSGVFTSAPKTQSGQWQRTLQKCTYGVTSFTTSDAAEWFAAVEDGVYRYDESTLTMPHAEKPAITSTSEIRKTRIIVNNQTDLRNHLAFTIMLYSPNGKKLGSLEPGGVLRHAKSGVYIVRRAGTGTEDRKRKR